MRLTRIRTAIILSLIASAFFARPSMAQTLQWHQTNGPYGGNISALAANSSTVFAALRYGGLYRSTNRGDFWAKADSGLPRGLPVTALAASGTLIFAGNDSGIYRSTNDGLSWMKMDTAPGWEILSLTSEGTLVLAGSSNGKIYRSTDSGVTWTMSLDLQSTVGPLQIVGSVILAGTYMLDSAEDCIWRSSDSGKTWFHSAYGFVHPIQTTDFAWSSPNLYSTCLNSGLYRSTDTGASWKIVDSTGDLQQPNNIAALGSVLLAVVRNHHTLMRSNDGGQSWTGVNGLESLQVWELGIQDSMIFAGTGGGIFRSNDSGVTWVEVDSGIIASDVDAFTVDSSGVYSGAYGGGVYRFVDTSANWERVGDGIPNAYVLSTARLGNDIYAGAADGDLYVLHSNSMNWAIVSALGCDSSFDNVFCLAVDSNEILAGTNCGIEGSTDSGRIWEMLDSNGGAPLSILAQGSLILVGINQGVDVSTDGGKTWTIYISFFGYEGAVRAITYNRNVFFCAWGGIYRSTDSAKSWIRVGTGLVGKVNALASNGTTVFAGTGFGIFLSTNNGDDWIQENVGLNDLQINAVALRGNELFAGTITGGVYETDISSLPSSVTSPAATANSFKLSLTSNPVSSMATFRFTTTEPEPVSISVFDPLGREVWSEHRNLPAGMQDVAFDARSLPAGAFFYQIRLGNETKSGVIIVER